MKITRINKKTITALLIAASLTSVNAAVSVVGNGTGIDQAGGSWQSASAFDSSSAAGLGSDGYIFYTTNAGVASATSVATITDLSIGYANPQNTYVNIDNPAAVDTSTSTNVGFLHNDGSTNEDLISFTVSSLAAGEIIRVGALINVEHSTNDRWDAESVSLTDGASTASITGLGGLVGIADGGFVFFDVDAVGTYTLSATAFGSRSAAFSGLTFDVIPEPSSTALLGLGGLALLARRRR